MGQEVTLSDEEVIKVLYNWVTGVMNLDVRGIATVTTNNKIRGIFKDIINTDMEFHEQLLTIGKERNALEVAPPATSAQSSLSMTEVSWLWLHIDTSQTDILQLETFMNNTKDKELLGEIQHELSKIFYPRLKQIEDLLKKEGFTVPSRPADRSQQQPEGRTNKIVLQDNEIISFLYTSAEVSMNNHLRAFSHAFRDDMRKLFKDFLFIEIENLERILKLAIKRNTLVKPPFVTSKRG
ncbi:MAG: DUF3231 family protein [Ruminiclostridium sp.]|nr:DUF3231 family protein [Ruminiclostridium sp.]